jgi:hypothetical protein
VFADQYALPIEPTLPAGQYLLSVVVQDVESGVELETVEYPIRVEGEAQPLVPALVEMEYAAGVTFGGEMWLLGYSAQQEGGRLEVALYWQALEAMEAKYKIFVHLLRAGEGMSLDGAQGEIVAQHDGMPRDWSYPTSMWGRGEVYVERIGLDVSGVEAGAYRLAVGVYEPERERLVAIDGSGRRLPDDRAVLGEVKLIEVSGQ